jgi:hypothetical protein
MKPTWKLIGKIMGALVAIGLFFFAQYNILEGKFESVHSEIAAVNLNVALTNTNIALIKKDTEYMKNDFTDLKTDFRNWQQRVDATLATWNIDVYEKLKKPPR